MSLLNAELTDKERRVLEIIKENQITLVPPMRMLAKLLGLKSVQSSAQYIRQLTNKGYIRKAGHGYTLVHK